MAGPIQNPVFWEDIKDILTTAEEKENKEKVEAEDK